MKWQHDHCWTQQLLRFGKLEGRVGLNRMKRLHRGVQLLAYLWTSQTSSWSTLLPLSLLSPLILHLLHQVFYPSLPLKPFTFKSSSETSHLHPSTTTPNAKYSLILVDTSAFLYIAGYFLFAFMLLSGSSQTSLAIPSLFPLMSALDSLLCLLHLSTLSV